MIDTVTMEHLRFMIRWDEPTFQYKVSAPLLDPDGKGVEVVVADGYDALRSAAEFALSALTERGADVSNRRDAAERLRDALGGEPR